MTRTAEVLRSVRASTLGTAAARFGLGSRVLVYAVLTVLVLQLAAGDRRANTDQGSGIKVLGMSGLGVAALLALVIGVGCYVLWRVSVAATSDGPAGDRWLALVEGLAYLPFGYMAVGVLTGDDAAATQGPRYRTLSAQIMQHTAGRWLIGAVGVVVVVVGLFLASQGIRSSFMTALRVPAAYRRVARAVRVVGQIGSTGRGVVFALAGALVVYAAVTADPDKSGGIDAAFDTVRAAPYGRYLLLLAAVAFAAFAVLTVVEAVWRDVRPAPD